MFQLTCCFLLLVIICSSYCAGITTSCRNGELLFEFCQCEKVSLDIFEAKLTCSGNEAVATANKVSKLSKEYPQFTELEIRKSKIEILSRSSLVGFSSVKSLGLSRNGITDVDTKFFSGFPNLESLDLSHNELKSVNKSLFRYCAGLHNLSLANNLIYFIEVDSFLELRLLQSLDLGGNKITNLSPFTFYGLESLRDLSLAMNNLHTLNKTVFKNNQYLEHVNLTGNHWVCNTDMLPLHDWLKKREVDKSYCAQPPALRNLTVQTGLYILYLETRLEESAICNTSMCNCSVSIDKQIVMVDCVGREFTKLPESLPYKTRVLDLRNNNIKSLNTDHVNATQWADVTFLHLTNNFIDSLKGLEGTWLLRNLVVLKLANNRLTEIPIHILEQFRGGVLDELYLSGNPWNCNCNTVRFQTWLQDNYKIIKDFDEIRCSSNSGIYGNQHIYRLLKSQLCPQDEVLVNYLDVLNGVMAAAIVLIVVKLAYDFWLQKRTGKLPRFFSLNI